ncbi:MAG: methylisocitrate lyase [Acidimicrobiales bacterium]
MLEHPISPSDRRRAFRTSLGSGRLLAFPGAFNALSARTIEDHGFDGVYVSGAVVSASYALPDIGLTNQSEVVDACRSIARAVALPVLADADTGFGEPANVARTIQLLEDAEAAGCHIEDQVNPKRCGHLENKELVGKDEMVRKIAAAVRARRDEGFVICARTDAAAVEGIDRAIDRSRTYVDAGADMVFPEALADESEFERVRKAIDVPLLANMTEFGKSKLLSRRVLEDLGINLVIYPVTLLRVAMGAVERALKVIRDDGSQARLVDEMQTRARLYELIDYAGYVEFDESVSNYRLDEKGS